MAMKAGKALLFLVVVMVAQSAAITYQEAIKNATWHLPFKVGPLPRSPDALITPNRGGEGDVVCSQLTGYSGTGNDASAVIQSCINATSPGGRLWLPPGSYSINYHLVIYQSIYIGTAGLTTADPPCDPTNAPNCCEIVAGYYYGDQSSDAIVRASIGLRGPVDGVHIDHLVINGNWQRRARIHASLCNSINFGEKCLVMIGSYSSLTNSVIKYGICWAGFQLLPPSSNFLMQGNTVGWNGARSLNPEQFFWSDGAGIFDAPYSQITNNKFIDNTDCDFISGGCAHCVIQNNFIAHSANQWSQGHAAMLLHQWPHSSKYNYYSYSTSGDYTGADVSHNWIQCGPGQYCGFGLSLGPGNWYPEPTNTRGGSVHDNTIFDAQLGFSVERANWITVYNNGVGTYQSNGERCGPADESGFYATTPDSPYYAKKCAGINRASGLKDYNIDPSSDIQVLDWSTTGHLYSRVDMEGCILGDL